MRAIGQRRQRRETIPACDDGTPAYTLFALYERQEIPGCDVTLMTKIMPQLCWFDRDAMERQKCGKGDMAAVRIERAFCIIF